MLSTSNSLIAKKRAKLNVKKTAKLNLNKDQLTTLNKMHNEVASHSLKTTKTKLEIEQELRAKKIALTFGFNETDIL